MGYSCRPLIGYLIIPIVTRIIVARINLINKRRVYIDNWTPKDEAGLA